MRCMLVLSSRSPWLYAKVPLAKKTAVLDLGTIKWSKSCEVQKPVMIRSAMRLKRERNSEAAQREAKDTVRIAAS
jgi:hypothetical protein